jgi:hypothetical protein
MTSIGHIYVIRTTLDTSFCYIGSTFDRLSKRFENHRNSYNNWLQDRIKHKRRYISIFDYFKKYGSNNFKIDLIKSYQVCRVHKKDHKMLHALETLWINKTKNCINQKVPFNPLRENKIYRKSDKRKYYENNTEKIKVNYKNYKKKNYEKNKEYMKKYYENNKQKVSCLNCGSVITNIWLTKHRKSIKCNKFVNLIPIVFI